MPTWKKYATTDLVTTAAPGLCPTLSNVVTEFLNGQGAFSVPAGGGPTIARKTADEDTTSTAHQNDDELLFPVAANEVWEFILVTKMHSNNVSGYVYAIFSIPTGASLLRMGAWGIKQTESDGTVEGTWGAGTTETYTLQRYLYAGGASGGNVQFQFRTNNVGYTATNHANSYIVAHQLA